MHLGILGRLLHAAAAFALAATFAGVVIGGFVAGVVEVANYVLRVVAE